MIVRAPRWKGTSLRGLGALNCPGDPGCPGYVEPGSNEQMVSLLNEILTNQSQAMQVPPGGNNLPIQDGWPTSGGSSFTSWLNQNAGLVLGVGGGIFALMLLARSR